VTRDELEFSLSQYLDGTLAEAERAALEERLAGDADARALLAEYQRLDVALKAVPRPAVDYDRLAGHICAAVSEQEEEPARIYRIGFVRTMAGLALAASVLIGVGFGIRLLQQNQTNPTGGRFVVNTPKEIIVVDAHLAAPGASTQPVEVIAVGPSQQFQDRPGFAGYYDDIVSRPSQVLIARSGEPAHDGSFLP
jgi:anti-sigma factor RsiW